MPLLSFIIVSYNQEAYVAEAVSSVLALQGGPYEIVIADDASTDATQAVIRRLLDRYDGPHEVRFKAHARNVGVQRNIELATRMCTGTFVVGMGGDDVSLPIRGTALSQIIGQRSDVSAVVSSCNIIDQEGHRTGSLDVRTGTISPLQMVANGGGVSVGPCYAYRRDCLEEYFATSSALSAEDRVIPLIASLRGVVLSTDQRLLCYRKHTASLSYTGSRKYLHPYTNEAHVAFVRSTLASAGKLDLFAGSLIRLKTARFAREGTVIGTAAALIDRGVSRLAGFNVLAIGSA